MRPAISNRGHASAGRVLLALTMGVGAGVGMLVSGCVGSGADGNGNGPNPPGSNGSGGSSGGNGSMNGSGGTTQPPGPPPAFDPGRVTMRRLNAIEYDNTIRDLLGIQFTAQDKPSAKFQFPADEWGDGFFNDGDVLSSSPLTIEKYLAAAQSAIDLALDPAPANMARARLLICDHKAGADAACVQKIVGELARRAFRRPVANDELTPYIGLIDVAKGKGASADVGLKLALSAVLVAPDFLFRVELDSTPGQQRQLNDFELASRLSYFIWASMPDEELFNRAKAGGLNKPAEIAKQVTRLMADPRAAAFSEAMSGQWMQTLALEFAKPNATTFPKWQDTLRPALAAEVNAFMAPILSGQVPVQDLVDAKYVYANRALGQFYGLPNAASLPVDSFEKVAVSDGRRGGVLRQGSYLVHTSHPTSHSPTIRGKFILDRLLCVKVPPPPAAVPQFMPEATPTGTLREKLIKVHHQMGSTCVGCHAILDPMGFALENYDGIGQWRDMDNGQAVDATGSVPGSGVMFKNAAELSAAIAKDERLTTCLAKQILTYATGRKMIDKDQALIDDIGKKFASGGMKFPLVVELVATSSAMTHRQAE